VRCRAVPPPPRSMRSASLRRCSVVEMGQVRFGYSRDTRSGCEDRWLESLCTSTANAAALAPLGCQLLGELHGLQPSEGCWGKETYRKGSAM